MAILTLNIRFLPRDTHGLSSHSLSPLNTQCGAGGERSRVLLIPLQGLKAINPILPRIVETLYHGIFISAVSLHIFCCRTSHCHRLAPIFNFRSVVFWSPPKRGGWTKPLVFFVPVVHALTKLYSSFWPRWRRLWAHDTESLIHWRHRTNYVSSTGFEPVTPALRGRCSTDWAMNPLGRRCSSRRDRLLGWMLLPMPSSEEDAYCYPTLRSLASIIQSHYLYL